MEGILTNEEIASALEAIIVDGAFNGYALLVAISHQAIDQWDRDTIRKFQLEREKCTYRDNAQLEIIADKIRTHKWD